MLTGAFLFAHMVMATRTIAELTSSDHERVSPALALQRVELDNFRIVMSTAEANAYASLVCRNSTTSVFEYGSGGSTLLSGACHVPMIISVDSSLEWLTKVNGSSIWATSPSQLTLGFVDIGPTGNWGYPTVQAHSNFQQYAAAISRFHIVPDVVFVDGRFRVSCALTAISFVSPTGFIVIHDFLHARGYHVVLKHLDVIAETETLVVLVRKRIINLTDLLNDVQKFAIITA